MITMDEARQIAGEKLRDIDRCTEYTTAYVFFNSNAEEADGGPDSPVVLLVESGKCCGMPEFISIYGGGKMIRTIKI